MVVPGVEGPPALGDGVIAMQASAYGTCFVRDVSRITMSREPTILSRMKLVSTTKQAKYLR